jgi:hypothetical protein
MPNDRQDRERAQAVEPRQLAGFDEALVSGVAV